MYVYLLKKYKIQMSISETYFENKIIESANKINTMWKNFFTKFSYRRYIWNELFWKGYQTKIKNPNIVCTNSIWSSDIIDFIRSQYRVLNGTEKTE